MSASHSLLLNTPYRLLHHINFESDLWTYFSWLNIAKCFSLPILHTAFMFHVDICTSCDIRIQEKNNYHRAILNVCSTSKMFITCKAYNPVLMTNLWRIEQQITYLKAKSRKLLLMFTIMFISILNEQKCTYLLKKTVTFT